MRKIAFSNYLGSMLAKQKIYGEEFFSSRQKELFPGMRRELVLEQEDVSTSSDPFESCMERKGYTLAKIHLMMDKIAEKLTPDMFGKKSKLTGAEAMFQEQVENCQSKKLFGVKFKPDMTVHQIRARIYDPKKIVEGTYFTRQSTTPGVSYIMGQDDKSGKFVTQSVRFDNNVFTKQAAVRWFKANIKRVQDRDLKNPPYPKPYKSKSNLGKQKAFCTTLASAINRG